jgi:hypothetical protein
MQTLTQQNGLPTFRLGEPGLNLVFENVLLPFVIRLASDIENSQRLIEVLEVIEELASSEKFYISNLVTTGFCEPLITTHQARASSIIPFMGSVTRKL